MNSDQDDVVLIYKAKVNLFRKYFMISCDEIDSLEQDLKKAKTTIWLLTIVCTVFTTALIYGCVVTVLKG